MCTTLAALMMMTVMPMMTEMVTVMSLCNDIDKDVSSYGDKETMRCFAPNLPLPLLFIDVAVAPYCYCFIFIIIPSLKIV